MSDIHVDTTSSQVFLSSFVYTPAYSCSRILTSEHVPPTSLRCSHDSRASKDAKLTIQPAFEYADSACLFFNTVVFSFFFFAFGRMPSRFCEMCGRIGNDMLCKGKNFGHEKVGSIGQNDGDPHP